MRKFYLYKRKNKRNTVFYVQFLNPQTGKLMPGKSTGQTNREEAVYTAMTWLKEGVPAGKTKNRRSLREDFSVDELMLNLKSVDLQEKDVTKIIDILKNRHLITDARQNKSSLRFIDFLTDFWDFDRSAYVREKSAYGQGVTRRHCNDMAIQIKNHWKPYFENMEIADLTKQDLKQFSIHLANKKKILQNGELSSESLKPSTVNRILSAGLTGLRWAYNNDILNDDITRGLKRFSGKSQKRGILTDKEVKKLFSEGIWTSPAVELGNLLSCQTGLRLGEVVGLRVEDIGEDRLYIRHSWSEVDRLKGTKTNESRTVPILPELKEKLLAYARLNPFGCGPGSFVFWSVDNPYRGESLSHGFNSAIASINIKEEERKARFLSFHGWRHYFARTMADALGSRTAKLTGHLTPEMLEHYADHANEQDFQKAKEATSEIFGRILPFQEAKVQ